MDAKHYICVTCGTQFSRAMVPPPECPICGDERQYVDWNGQRWTTLRDMRDRFKNMFQEQEPGLISIRTKPKFAIGQRAFLVRTSDGNLLWDCVSLLDEPTRKTIKRLGGLRAIAVSHPHFYASMVEWSERFDNAPIYLHREDRGWLMRPEGNVTYWSGRQLGLFGGMRLVHTGGHFSGYQVLCWPDQAGQTGVLLTGDQPTVCMDRRWVSFMWSYPNLIPLSAAAVGSIVRRVRPIEFDRLYSAFPGRQVLRDAKAIVERSANRYVRAMAHAGNPSSRVTTSHQCVKMSHRIAKTKTEEVIS